MKTTSAAHSLIELLCVTCVITILAALLLPPVIRAYNRAKCWAVGCFAFHEWRIEAVDNDTWFERLCTNKPAAWTYVAEPKQAVVSSPGGD